MPPIQHTNQSAKSFSAFVAELLILICHMRRQTNNTLGSNTCLLPSDNPSLRKMLVPYSGPPHWRQVKDKDRFIRQSAWEVNRAEPPPHPRTRMNSVPTMVRAWVVRRDFRVLPTGCAPFLWQLRDDLAFPEMPVTIVGTLFICVRGWGRACTDAHLFPIECPSWPTLGLARMYTYFPSWPTLGVARGFYSPMPQLLLSFAQASQSSSVTACASSATNATVRMLTVTTC
jgi:hypothetical protein